MGPSNARELEIAREVDKLSIRDELNPGIVPEILAFLDFTPSKSETEFLMAYLRWRMVNPIAK